MHLMLLPHLDQTAIYNQFNFNVNCDRSANSGFAKYVIPTFRCPSDSNYVPTGTSRTDIRWNGSGLNYAASGGPSLWYAVTPTDEVGMFNKNITVRMADLTDGSSNVIAVVEQILPTTDAIGSLAQGYYGGSIGSLPKSYASNSQLATFSTSCLGTSGTLNNSYNVNTKWANSDVGQSVAMTLNTPNSARPDCLNACVGCWAFTALGVKSSRSRHTGGIQGLLADGSVHFFSNNIDILTWQNLGARNDGRVLGEF